MQKTKIEWSEFSWNFLRGCRRVSPGCQNCYAEQIAGRFSGKDKNGKELPYFGLATKNGEARWTGKVSFHEDILLEPLKRKKPTTYFVNSMSDLFYEEVKDEWIDKAFAVMALTPQHTYQILTKRPKRMRDYLTNRDFDFIRREINNIPKELGDRRGTLEMPLFNCWLGVSVENQKEAKIRIPHLLKTPAAIRFLSCEPLLEKLYLTCLMDESNGARNINTLDAESLSRTYCSPYLGAIDWVIVGGESGANARPCDISWIRSIVEQCKSANVSCFVKQLGANVFNSKYLETPHKLKLKDKKGGDLSEFPPDLQIRQMPEQAKETL